MTNYRRYSILAIAVLLAAGCGTTPPTAMPSASIAAPTGAIGSPAPTAAAITPAPTFGAEAPCEALGLEITPTFIPGAIDAYLGPLDSHIALSTERAVSVADPSVVWPGGYDYGDGLPDLIGLRGGGEVAMHLELDYDFEFDWPVQVTAISAVLRIPGEGRRTLESRIAESPDPAGTMFVTLPDMNARGTLTLEVEAADRCLAYTSRGVGQVQIARAALVDGCPTDTEGFVEHWESMGDPPIDVDGLGVALSPDEMIGLWTPGAFGSQGNSPLSHWDAAADSATGDPGGVVSLQPRNTDLRIESLSASFYRRGAVVDWLSGGGDPRQVFLATADPYPDGHLDLLVPSDPGRYVVGLVVRWETPCLRGGAVGAVGVDVE